MAKLTMGVDLDGCIFDFSTAYAKCLTEETGIVFPPCSDTWPPVWFWEREMGVTPEQEKAVWNKYILKGGTFWQELEAYDEARDTIKQLNRLSKNNHDIYFITHRMGVEAKYQTEKALYELGADYPTVLMTGNKLPIIQSLGIDFFIDDKPETVLEIAKPFELSIQRGLFHLFIKDAPYNRLQTYPETVKRVGSVAEAIKKVGLWKE